MFRFYLFIHYLNYSNSKVQIALFSIRIRSFFKNWIYSIFGIRYIFKNRKRYSVQIYYSVQHWSRQPNLIPFAAIDQWNDISTILCIFRPSNIHLKHLLFLFNVVAADVATRTLSLRRPVIHRSADTSWYLK